jgi:hypothetical protein
MFLSFEHDAVAASRYFVRPKLIAHQSKHAYHRPQTLLLQRQRRCDTTRKVSFHLFRWYHIFFATMINT